jgi:RNA polymerase sigma factor (sigma-70 family)
MATKLPQSIETLLLAPARGDVERAWADVLSDFSGLILHVARSTPGDHDAVMDRYLFVLEALRRDDFRRLRQYSVDGRGSFTTWLVAVARRLCIDCHRQRYGRTNAQAPSAEQLERRELADLLTDSEALDTLAFPGMTPDLEICAAETRYALDGALSRLDVSDRLLLRLRYEDELPVLEIAGLMGESSPFPVYRRIEKVLAFLRRELGLAGLTGAAE